MYRQAVFDARIRRRERVAGGDVKTVVDVEEERSARCRRPLSVGPQHSPRGKA